MTAAGGSPDLVITNALILDPVFGVIKGDIGVKDGRIAAIGKAGNPDIMDGVDPALVIGPGTEVIAGEHMIATPGGVDSHIHMIAPQQAWPPSRTASRRCSAAAPAPPTARAPPPPRPAPGTSRACSRPPRPCP